MILACDPGLQGAFALYNGAALKVLDMPTVLRPAGQRNKPRPFPDRPAILRQLYGVFLMGLADWLFIEQVGGIPGQSAHGAFTFGHGAGYITGAAEAIGYQVVEVPPMVWKSAMKCPADDEKACDRATVEFPAYAANWAKVRGNGAATQRSGRAEAALLAKYGWMLKGPQP